MYSCCTSVSLLNIVYLHEMAFNIAKPLVKILNYAFGGTESHSINGLKNIHLKNWLALTESCVFIIYSKFMQLFDVSKKVIEIK